MTSEKNNTALLTEGPIISTMLALAIPIMASSFLSTFYNIMDTVWVGKLGAKAVAGVGVGGMYLWFSTGIITVARMGGQVHVAQSIGREQMEEARKYARATLQMVLFSALVFALVCAGFTRDLVAFFQLHDVVAETCAIHYTRITCGMIIFSFMNITLSGLFTAQGDSKTPLIANFSGLLLNMILDPLLILGLLGFPRLEETGAAIATVFSQAIVFVVMLYKIFSVEENHLFRNQNMFRPTAGKYYKNVFILGFPAGIQSLIYCFISMILGRIVAVFGAAAYAVQRVGGEIESLTWNTADGFGSALNAFCGQNFGAKKYDRIRKGYCFSWSAMFLWGFLVTLAFVLFPRLIANAFFHEEEVIAIAVGYFVIVGWCEPFMSVELTTNSGLCGLGLTKLCSAITIVVTALRIPLAYLLMDTSLGLKGIWWALTITSILKGVIFTLVFIFVSSRLDQLKQV